MVVLRGLSGRFPDAPRLAHLEVRDARGVWLTLDDVALDWSPTALIGRVARLDRVSAGHVQVARLPVPSAAPAKPQPPSTGGFSLPVGVDLRALRVDRLDLASPVAGSPAALRITGTGGFRSLDDARAKLAIDRLDGAGAYRVDGIVDAHAIRATLGLDEPAGGLVSGLAKLPGARRARGSRHGGRPARQRGRVPRRHRRSAARRCPRHGRSDPQGRRARCGRDSTRHGAAPGCLLGRA